MDLPMRPPIINFMDNITGQIKRKFKYHLDKYVEIEDTRYAVLEVSPSKLTANTNVKWMITEFSRLYSPLTDRINLSSGKICYSPEHTVWWEVFLYKGHVKFYLVVPDKDYIKVSLQRQLTKTWKNANVKEVKDYLPSFPAEDTAMVKLSLANDPTLALDVENPQFCILESILNAKYYLKDEDAALLQIGMTPLGNDYNATAKEAFDRIKKTGIVPKKKGKKLTPKDFAVHFALLIGLVSEELLNMLGSFLIPGWEDNRSLSEALKKRYEGDARSTKKKLRSDCFNTEIRIVAKSNNLERRRSILRAVSSGFDPLEGDNKLVEMKIETKQLPRRLGNVTQRRTEKTSDILCALELAKVINIPDQKLQSEHHNDLDLVSHRGETEVPKEIFVDDGGIPFMQYEDNDGNWKTVYFSAKNPNLLCMARVFIGEPGTGKTTAAINFGLDAFFRGYGIFAIDAADGKMIQKMLKFIPPELRSKVKVIDLTHPSMAVGLGWNEAFSSKNLDIVEDLLVEEVITYIELVAGTELNMTAKQWVENAVKAVFVTPDATLQDVENMINNAEYRKNIIPTISDPELQKDWEYYHERMKPEERKAIYDQIYRRMAQVVRKKALKTFILQKPKKDANGEYLVNFRKWMDEGYMVLVKANETLGETIQTSLISFLIAKFNLAMISREDIDDEDDRRPCFLLLDEPDHYIKGSERWRNMLTRYRKYRCGLVFMFHGWQQLTETDRNLPKIIRKAGPHYVVYQTDLDNLLELQPVIEPEFKIKEIAKGIPKQHAIVKLKMYSDTGEAIPAFMAKSVPMPQDRFPQYDNSDLYDLCMQELGRNKQDVLKELHSYKTGTEFTVGEEADSIEGDGELDMDNIPPKETNDPPSDLDRRERANRRMVYEVGTYIEEQIEKGEEPDLELLLHLDELLEEGDSGEQ